MVSKGYCSLKKKIREYGNCHFADSYFIKSIMKKNAVRVGFEPTQGS